MSLAGNIIWLICGGFMIALEYLAASIILMVTIIGFPFGWQTLKLANLAFWPFGREAVAGQRSSGCLYVIVNIIWFFVAGIWISLSHIGWGILLCITIVGIPFGVQHFKLVGVALFPFGRDIVEKP